MLLATVPALPVVHGFKTKSALIWQPLYLVVDSDRRAGITSGAHLKNMMRIHQSIPTLQHCGSS